MIKAIFFDVGSTLLYPSPDVPGVFHEVARDYGYDFPVEQIEPHMPAVYAYYEDCYAKDASFWADDARSKQIWVEMYTLLGELLGVGEERAEIALRVHVEFGKSARWAAYDDVMPMLERLKERDLKIGLISNWGTEIDRIIPELPMADYIDDVVSSGASRLHKPDHRIFELALMRLGVEAHESVHVGDHPVADVEGATAIGMAGVLLDRSAAPLNTRSISTLDELEGFLLAAGMELPEIG